MKERPILMSAPMVRAILDDRKTKTRRVVKGIALDWLAPEAFTPAFVADPANSLCPYGVPGDRLWVRETWSFIGQTGVWELSQARPGNCQPIYRADGAEADRWWPSIHMPRWASRITLQITDVRVERLAEISEEDAVAEGVHVVSPETARFEPVYSGWEGAPIVTASARDAYRHLWNHINGPGAWAENPWVWAISFNRIPTPTTTPGE